MYEPSVSIALNTSSTFANISSFFTNVGSTEISASSSEINLELAIYFIVYPSSEAANISIEDISRIPFKYISLNFIDPP